jgi:Kdo2-lipid IVA lauroyltransferase/acyltransferase
MFAYWILILARNLFCVLPVGFARALGRWLGKLGFYLDWKHRNIALDNLRQSFPEKTERYELRKIARSSFGELGFNLVELLRIPRFIEGDWMSNFHVRGEENIREAFGRSRGVIFVISHFGNWEYLGFMPRLLSFRGAAVGQKIKNPAVDGLIKDTREKIGLDLLSKREVASSIKDYLASNGAVAILADQRARRMSIDVPFFGRLAPTTAAPAVFALKTGAALIPVFMYLKEDGKYQVLFEREVKAPPGLSVKESIVELTCRFTSVFEEKIRERPELWFWVHRRWGK